jgi:predicted sulfurtransferase
MPATLSGIGVPQIASRRLHAAERLHALMQVVIAHEGIDAKVGAADERTAHVQVEICERLVLQRAVRARIRRNARREIFVLQMTLRQQPATRVAFQNKPLS